MSPRLLIVESDEHAGRFLAHAFAAVAFEVDWVADTSAARRLLASRTFAVVALGEGPTPEGLWPGLETLAHRAHLVTVLRVTFGAVVRQSLFVPALPAHGTAAASATPLALAKAETAMSVAAADRRGRRAAVDCRVALLPSRAATLNGVPAPRLSCKEYRLLELLTRKPGALVSREAMQEVLYRWGEEVGPTAVEAHVSGIRKKLGTCLIENVRGLGYRLSACNPRASHAPNRQRKSERDLQCPDRSPSACMEIASYFDALAGAKE
jgi:DNA-binding response OmpR family regulator